MVNVVVEEMLETLMNVVNVHHRLLKSWSFSQNGCFDKDNQINFVNKKFTF